MLRRRLLQLSLLPAALALGFVPSGQAQPTPASAWTTLHGDTVRSGFYPSVPRPPLKLVWRKELWRELTGPRSEVIVADGLAFMGTYAGNLYAWDAATGGERWTVRTEGPVGHSPAAAGGVLYFGSMDGGLYAVATATGKPKWIFRASEGIWTSPAVAGGRVFFGARDGVFYALRAADGKLAWKLRTGAPILAPPSATVDGRRVLFVSEDMHLYCADAATGKLFWKSRKLQGITARDHAPTLVGGLALVTTSPARDFHQVLDRHQELLVARTGFTGPDKRYIPGTPEDVRREQDAVVDYLKANPSEQTFYAFNLADGKEPWIAPILYTGGLHNPPTPPCFNPQTGEVFVYTRSAYGVWDGGGEVRPFTGVGRLDLKTGRVNLIEHAHRPRDAARPAGSRDLPFASFNTIGDETQALSCSPEFLFSNHQGTLGSLNLKTGLCQVFWGKRDSYAGFYGPATFGWENQGGLQKARQAGQPYGVVNEWHGPDKSIASVVGRRLYYSTGSQVLCLEGS